MNAKVGFFGLLGLIFITLKLSGVINWSWFLVLAPIYGPVALLLLFFGGIFALAYIVGFILRFLPSGRK